VVGEKIAFFDIKPYIAYLSHIVGVCLFNMLLQTEVEGGHVVRGESLIHENLNIHTNAKQSSIG